VDTRLYTEMRKLLLFLLVLIVTLSILWVFAGRQISTFVDQYKMAELESTSIRSISYEGSGDGGTLAAGDHRLTLSPINPHVGSTKENELALATAGKVFAFGPMRSSEPLAADAENSDTALLTRQRSYLVWPSFNAALLTVNRAEYYKLTWNKQNGAKLEMVWSIDPNSKATSLIRIDISGPAR
jgi:hypothetical protein